ncbi:hypothetical protein [Methylorubrum suomiense]|uniref:Uncharacterized protein n=1 Tax=Methylorubrum suomiense TaxID=144191 RepID=A0ABQ4V1J3_9HYPH|nr:MULTISPECIES: hypothetical protein [Methylobacteriaceae]GJE77558.1 hypothetical protein BGCPKDLD_4163 [Methylorubrum suomiense]
MDKCEAELEGGWTVIGIKDALGKHKGVRFRCWSCRGQVAANRDYSDGARAHFAHRKAFPACKKVPGGAQFLHPEAIS